MTNRFVVFTDEKYLPLCNVLVESLLLFSKADICVVSVNFDFECSDERVMTGRIDVEYTEMCGFSMARLRYLTKLRGHFILLDADTVANWNVDELFSLCDQGYLFLQQPGVCGQLDLSTSDILRPYPGFIYCNTVPLICSNGFSEWLINIWPSIEHFKDLSLQTRQAPIDDELTLNWLRCASLEKSHITISSPDRQFLAPYIEGMLSIQKLHAHGMYNGRHVTWHMFHGEKNPLVAREMFNQLKQLGPDFLYWNASRNRRPRIYD